MKLKRNWVAALAGILLLGGVTGCASSDASDADTVKMMVSITGGKDEEEMELWAQKLSEATGLNIIIEKPASDYDQVLMQKLSGGEKYDLVYGNYYRLVDQGAAMDVTDLIEASSILMNNIEKGEWDDLRIDGKLYGGFNKQEIHRVVALNNNLLKAAGIDYTQIEPTLDGYYNVFKALKENSTERDFYPFNVILKDGWDIQPWMAAAGLKDGITIDNKGDRYAQFASDEAAPVWEWFTKLYDEGLMDPSSFIDQTKDMRAKMGASSIKTAVTVDWAAWVGLHNANALAEGITPDVFEVVSLPGVQTPDGEFMLGKGGASTFIVPANAENPEGAIKILEYFATQEGGELLSIGIEGHDYTLENGNYKLTDIGSKHGSDHGAPVPIYKNFKHPIGFNPGVEEALSYGEYATINMPIPNEGDFKATIGKWGIQIVKGEVSALEGLAKMRAELVTLGVTDR